MGTSDAVARAALIWLTAIARVVYTTLCNYLVGLTPEENHWRKGEAWSRVGAYRRAAWHFRKYLTYSDDPRVRPQLAWCYAQMGTLDSAALNYRQAYARNNHPAVALGLAQLESELGNIEAARALVHALGPSRHELSVEGVALLDSLARHLEAAPGVRVRTGLAPEPTTRFTVQTEFGSLDIVAAKWVLGRVPCEALPRIAVDALEAGFDTPSLRRLAGELHPTLGETGSLFEQVLDELGTAIPDRSRAAMAIARSYAAQVTEGSLTPYQGAHEIWRLELEVEGLMAELGPFVYWVSEWQEADGQARRAECESAIRVAAFELIGAL